MGSKLNPVVPHHIFESLIATQSSQSPLPREMLDLTSNNVFHAESLKSYILFPSLSEVLIDLIFEKGSLDIFEREIVEFKYSKIFSKEPGILVRC